MRVFRTTAAAAAATLSTLSMGLSMGLSMPVQAAPAPTCPAGSTAVTSVDTFVSGKNLCATRGADSWQEWHNPVGNVLRDYKMGASDPVDPSKDVGTWSATGSVLTHTYTTYGPADSYSWLVCQVTATPTSYVLVSADGKGGTNLPATFTATPGASSCSTLATARPTKR